LPGFRSEILNFSSSGSFSVEKRREGSSRVGNLILPLLALLLLNLLAILINRDSFGSANRFLAGGLSGRSQVLGTVSAPLSVEINRGFLTGKIADRESGIPIDNALIYVFENDNFALTGRTKSSVDGSFEISLLPGVYKITVSKLGYENQSQTVKIISGERTVNNFYLGSYWLMESGR